VILRGYRGLQGAIFGGAIFGAIFLYIVGQKNNFTPGLLENSEKFHNRFFWAIFAAILRSYFKHFWGYFWGAIFGLFLAIYMSARLESRGLAAALLENCELFHNGFHFYPMV
jgi:ABC-type nitrate/sulfonate/bicarbonate transport system permease component